MNEDQVKQLIKEEVVNMFNFNRMPFSVQESIKERLGDTISLTLSAKDATEENQAVNEAGTGTYSVLGIPDGYLKVDVNGLTRFIPFWN